MNSLLTLVAVAALTADPDLEAIKSSLQAQINIYSRVGALETRVSDLERDIDALRATSSDKPLIDLSLSPDEIGQNPPPVSNHDTSPAPSQKPLAVCQCRGHNESVCFCLKTGQKCHCSRDSGSVWNMTDDGRPINKTGQKADPDVGAIAAAPAATSPASGSGYAVQVNGAWAYWTDANGTQWNNQGSGLTEGQSFNYGGQARFVYRNGRMHDSNSTPSTRASQSTQTQQPAARGYFKTVCHGTWCERVWVPY